MTPMKLSSKPRRTIIWKSGTSVTWKGMAKVKSRKMVKKVLPRNSYLAKPQPTIEANSRVKALWLTAMMTLLPICRK